TLQVPLYFILWYVLNVLYNITNKWALQDIQNLSMAASLPITIGCLQFAIGSVYACTLWMLGSRPVPHKDEVRMIANRETSHIAIHHTLGQLCTVLTLAANSISFAHVIKAMEPFFSAIASRFFLGQRMDIRVYLALVPVVGGVMMACAGSNEFSWVSFGFGMGSNAFFAMRAVSSKTDEKGHPLNTTTMSPSNLFAAVTCMSFIFSVPIGIILEGHILIDLFKFIANGDISNATTNDATIHFTKTIMYVLSSGLFHYLNNEVMYLVLSNVHPITLAVGNTMKRVFIIVAGVLVFSTPVTTSTAIGSTVGIGGVFVYSLMK
ncbi:triose or hexose phosphate translocator, partial [Thalassiosira pseudonana CCMP1335]